MTTTLIVRVVVLFEKVSALQNNLKPEASLEMQGTQEQSKSETWCRLTASKCLSAFQIGKLVSESQPNAAVKTRKFTFSNKWGLGSQDFQTYWMRYGLECEPKVIMKND